MTILAVDTTALVASVAIRVDGRTIAELSFESHDGFGHLIFAAIEKCKNEAKLDLHHVDCFAAAAGPGSFTGVRVGLATVKGLAESMTKPAIAISNLMALSSFGNKAGSLRAAVLDARRGDVYAAVYDQALRLLTPESVQPFAAWLSRLDPAVEYEFIAPSPLRLEGTPFAGMPFTEAPQALAAAVALCAESEGQAGKWLDPAALDANYVRHTDAELSWKDRQPG